MSSIVIDYSTSGISIAQDFMAMGMQDPDSVMIPRSAFNDLAVAIEEYASFQASIVIAGEDL